MLAGGETVLAAVSGGSDSVALLYLLARLAPSWRLRLRVLHVDHQLRRDSAGDGEFVRRLAAELGVPADVVAIAVKRGGSPEAAAREARYRALYDHADRLGADRIAVAHTADDQAETVLMRLLQGTGLRGVAGIPPTRGRIVRPLLAERRGALRALLAGTGIDWIEDPTNDDRDILRNRLRHDLLPALAATYNPEIVGALVRTAGLARRAADALEGAAARELDRLARPGAGELILPLRDLHALHPEVAAEVLRLGAVRLGGPRMLRAWAQRELRRALARPAPRHAVALGGLTIEVSVGALRLSRGAACPLASREIPVPGRVVLGEIGLALHSELGGSEGTILARDPWRVVFDADHLLRPLIVRGRRAGDRMTPFGAVGERAMKGILVDARVPRWERDRIPIVQAGPAIAWAGGIRRSALAPVSADTRRVLRLVLSPLAESEAAAHARTV